MLQIILSPKIIYHWVNAETIHKDKFLDTYNFPIAVLLYTLNNSGSIDTQWVSKRIAYKRTHICWYANHCIRYYNIT